MYTLLFKENKEIFQICKEIKKGTARKTDHPIFKNLKVGDYIKIMIGFKEVATVKVTDIKYNINMKNEKLETFKKLGYKTKKEYLNEYKEKEDQKQNIIYFKLIKYDLNKYIESYKM